MTAPVLAYPGPSKTFLLDTDCSKFAIGAVLSQSHDGQEHPVAYYSRTLSRAERNYCVTRRELLAVVEIVKHFHHYLYGVEFKIRSDHGALSRLLRFKIVEGQLCRWFQVLSTYHFTVEHRTDCLHRNADGLSRRPCISSQCGHCEKHEQKDAESLVTSCKCPESASAPLPGTKSYCTVSTQTNETPKINDDTNPAITAVTRSENKTWLASMTSDQWHQQQM